LPKLNYLFENDRLEILTELGLTVAEAKIYLTLVKLGQTTAQTVAKNAQVDRSETYRVICKLEQKGYLHRIIGNPNRFEASKLTCVLSSLLSERKMVTDNIERQATQLLRLWNPKVQQKDDEYVRFIPRIKLDLQNIKKEVLSIKHSEDVVSKEMLPGLDLTEETWKALDGGVRIRCIVNKEIFPKKVQFNKHPNFSLYFTNRPIHMDISIIDDSKVRMIILKEDASQEPYAQLLSSNACFLALAKGYFEFMLEHARPVRKSSENTRSNV
jgi:sugar-specific transcriptional regulator TrmB